MNQEKLEKREKQQQQINELWEEITNGDEDLPATPKLKNPVKEERFENQYIKNIEKFRDKTEDWITLYMEYKREFLDIRENLAENRFPKNSNNIIYFIILAVLVILEVPTNYMTINNLLHKPLVSLFITIAVGSILVFIAHFHGMFFKQLKFVIQTPDSERSTKMPSKWMRIGIFFATVVILIGLFYALYYIRTQYYYDILGGSFDQNAFAGTQIFTKVLTLMVANVVIYILGFIASFIHSDPIPTYQETYKNMNKYKNKIKKEYIKLDKELENIENRHKEIK